MSHTDRSKNGAQTLLVWITNPEAAGRIVGCAREFADRSGLGLKVVSVQAETRDNWHDTIADLERLDEAAKAFRASLTVVYSDDRLSAAKKLISETEPDAMFAGTAAPGSRSRFADEIVRDFPGIPLYCVGPDEQVSEYGKTTFDNRA